MVLAAGTVRFQAVLFDLDGVLTATARVHQAAWKETFDAFLEQRAARTGEQLRPFTADDYLRYVDGKLREEGVRGFLHSRGIDLPDEAPPSDTPNSVRSLAARKNEGMARFFRPDAIEVFPGSLAVVRAVRARGMKTAVVSSSSNCRAVLAVTQLGELFDTVVEGTVAAELGLRGKPAPDTFLEAARRLGVAPDSAVVIEDAVVGVRAAREGGFGLVIGVDRHGNARALRQAGAHLVVADLWELIAGLESGHRGPKLHRLLEIARNIAAGEHVIHQEPWKLVVHKPAPELAPQIESMLAVSNGYLGVRGSPEEGAPRFHAATLLNGFHETWPIDYPEHAYGFARTGQTILNVCDGSCIQLFAEGELLDPLRHDVSSYERSLLLDRGLLERKLVWRLASGARIAVRSQRLVSLRDRHLACIVYEIEALDGPVSVTLCSLFAEARALQTYDEIVDPRRRVWTEALRRESRELTASGVLCTYATKLSGLHLACGMAHQLLGGDAPEMSVREEPELIRYTVSTRLVPGRAVRLEKFLAYHYAGGEAARDMRYRAEQTLAHACRDGAPRIIAQQEEAMREFWRDSDVEIAGNVGLQFALRYSIFQLMQATARTEGHGIPAKGLTGEGYEGHYFWDSEIYVLPFLIYTRPKLARELLLHRYMMLDRARERARELGLRGALFPWRTINGEEASPSYASGTAQYHINADIAFALRKYVEVTGDRAFLRQFGAEILVETARLWHDLGFFSKRKDGQFVINGVTGPDEYTTVVDNNAFTNLMARENLLMAVRALETLQREDPDGYDHVLTVTQLSPGEPESWQLAADAMYVPYDEEAQVHLQDDTFLDQEPWDFRATPAEQYPLLLHFHPLTIYRHQVIKQADVMLACFLLGNYFSSSEKRRIFDYYDPLTTGDSSLSECIQSIVACEVGEAAIAHRYLMGSATTDLADLHKNVRDGMHIASAGGTWMAMVYGFAGLRDYGGELSFRPSLPPHWQKLRFRLHVRSSLLEVELGPSVAVYRLLEGPGLVLTHRSERISLGRGEERRLHDPLMAPERWSESDAAAAAASDSQLARAAAAAE